MTDWGSRDTDPQAACQSTLADSAIAQSSIPIPNPQFPIQSPILNPNRQSSIRESAICNLQSAICSRQAAAGSLFELDERDPAAALIVGRRAEVRHERMQAKELRDRAAQRAGA